MPLSPGATNFMNMSGLLGLPPQATDTSTPAVSANPVAPVVAPAAAKPVVVAPPKVNAPVQNLPPVTPPTPTSITPAASHTVMSQALTQFPFDPGTVEQLNKVPVSTYDPSVNTDSGFAPGTESASYYQTPGTDIVNFLNKMKIIPSAVTGAAASAFSFADPGGIHLSSSATPDDAAHEALNYVFNNGAMGGATAANGNDASAQRAAFANAWSKIVAKGTDDPAGDTLYAIDKQIDNLNENGDYDRNSDRYAFLGTQVAKDGIQVIPPELRPFYAGVIKGAVPTPATGPLEQKPSTLLDKITGATEYARDPAITPLQAPPPQGVNPIPTDFQPALQDAYKRYPDLPKGLAEATLMAESSMGANTNNQKTDLGKYGYLGGHTTTGAFADMMAKIKATPDLAEKVAYAKVPGIKNLATPYAAIQATAGVLASLHRNNPDLSPADLYFEKYNADPKVDTPARRAMFNQFLQYYSGNQQSTGPENDLAASATM